MEHGVAYDCYKPPGLEPHAVIIHTFGQYKMLRFSN